MAGEKSWCRESRHVISLGWEHLRFLWCAVLLSQISKTEFSSKICSCCSHISAFYVPCHCVLWNDADVSPVHYFYYEEFSVHLFPVPTTGHQLHCWLLLWALALRDLVSTLLASGSCFPKVFIDKEVRCLTVPREFLDSCQPWTSISVVYLHWYTTM